jgi:hypothetical protein
LVYNFSKFLKKQLIYAWYLTPLPFHKTTQSRQ